MEVKVNSGAEDASWVPTEIFKKLPPCSAPQCHLSVKSLECQRLGCRWCRTYAQGVNDTTSECGDDVGTCPPAPTTIAPTTAARTTPARTKPPVKMVAADKSGLDGGVIAGIAVAAVVLLCVLVVVVVVVRKLINEKKKKDGEKERREMEERIRSENNAGFQGENEIEC